MTLTPTHLLIHSCTVQRRTTAADASNFPTGTFADHPPLVNLPCRIQPMSGTESVRYGGESNRRMWRVFMETGHDITEKDRIRFVDDSTGSNITRTLDIQQMRNPQLFGTIYTIICEETQIG